MSVLDEYLIDPKVSLLDKTRIQAQVLVPVVRALRAELGKEAADALVRRSLRDWSKQGICRSTSRPGRLSAVIEATSHRFRPILLTAAAAILGMIPIAPTIFWGPMAYAIMGGLALATLLTLVFLPALYLMWFRIKSPLATSPQNMPVGGTAVSTSLT